MFRREKTVPNMSLASSDEVACAGASTGAAVAGAPPALELGRVTEAGSHDLEYMHSAVNGV